MPHFHAHFNYNDALRFGLDFLNVIVFCNDTVSTSKSKQPTTSEHIRVDEPCKSSGRKIESKSIFLYQSNLRKIY